jgi:hypothetical protein
MLTISILFTVFPGFMEAFWSMPLSQRRGVAYIFPIAGVVELMPTFAFIPAQSMGWITQ